MNIMMFMYLISKAKGLDGRLGHGTYRPGLHWHNIHRVVTIKSQHTEE